jgi:hypothetical protein
VFGDTDGAAPADPELVGFAAADPLAAAADVLATAAPDVAAEAAALADVAAAAEADAAAVDAGAETAPDGLAEATAGAALGLLATGDAAEDPPHAASASATREAGRMLRSFTLPAYGQVGFRAPYTGLVA